MRQTSTLKRRVGEGPKNENYRGTDIDSLYGCPFSQKLLPQMAAGP